MPRDLTNLLKALPGKLDIKDTHLVFSMYRKFGNFCENSFVPNSAKRHFWHIQNFRLRHHLPTSVNDIVIWPFWECFIFTKLPICKVSGK